MHPHLENLTADDLDVILMAGLSTVFMVLGIVGMGIMHVRNLMKRAEEPQFIDDRAVRVPHKTNTEELWPRY